MESKLVVGVLLVSLMVVDGNVSVGDDTRLEPRIIRGEDAQPGDAPYSVRLEILSKGIQVGCSGSIIGELHVITAFHCVNRSIPEGVKVFVGELTLNDDPITHTVRAIHIAPRSSDEYGSDIAVLELESPIMFRRTLGSVGAIEPVQLPDEDTVILPGEQGLIAGWGLINKFNGTASRLQKLDAFVGECIERHDHTICLSLPDGNGSNVCKGDSGSGFVRKKLDNSSELLGVISVGLMREEDKDKEYECGKLQPMLVKVSDHVQWVKQVMTHGSSIYQEYKSTSEQSIRLLGLEISSSFAL